MKSKPATQTRSRSSRKPNEFERLVLLETAREIMRTAERDPRQTLRALYGFIQLQSLSVAQLYDFITRWKEKRLWNDPRLQMLTRGIGYKPRGEA